jgi:hypothetical protein
VFSSRRHTAEKPVADSDKSRYRLRNGIIAMWESSESQMTIIRLISYWKVIMSVRLSVGALGFKGWFVMLPLR